MLSRFVLLYKHKNIKNKRWVPMFVKKSGQNKGFTIIEVLIVLAIAGLIMLIVFLAVPALNRNARNTQRRDDVAALMAMFAETLNNNNASQPATCNGASATCWVKDAKLSIIDNTTATNVVWTKNASAPGTAPTNTNVDNVVIQNYLKCSGSVATTTGASSRSVAACLLSKLPVAQHLSV